MNDEVCLRRTRDNDLSSNAEVPAVILNTMLENNDALSISWPRVQADHARRARYMERSRAREAVLFPVLWQSSERLQLRILMRHGRRGFECGSCISCLCVAIKPAEPFKFYSFCLFVSRQDWFGVASGPRQCDKQSKSEKSPFFRFADR